MADKETDPEQQKSARNTDQPETNNLNENAKRQIERRTFIQAAALGAVGLTTGAFDPLKAMADVVLIPQEPDAQRSRPSSQPKFDHLVVVMMENRSFDHMLGRLYLPDNPPPFDKPPRGQHFDGIDGSMSNPVSPNYSWLPSTIPVSRTKDYTTPPDDLVGHQFPDAEMQVGAFPTSPSPQHMKGFVNNRVLNLGVDKHPPLSQVKAPMEGFSPTEHLANGDGPYAAASVLNTLANSFAVCDNWYSSLPGPTLVNRSFLHAGTSNNWVSNSHNWDGNKNETIFNRLGEGNWKIYNGDGNTECLTFIIHPTIKFGPATAGSIEEFVADAAAGTLPSYSFIEPEVISYDYGQPPDDQHPPRDIRLGEKLITTVYQAVRNSPLWPRTFMIVIYDEHGGFFDHSFPPPAVPPHQHDEPGEDGFKFDVLGVRVPAVLISPLIEQGTVFHASQPVDHTAVIKTLCSRFDLEHLTDRDAHALDLAEILGDAMRSIDDTPDIPLWPVPESELGDRPLNDLQRELVLQAARKYGVPLPPMTMASEAKEFVRSLSRMTKPA